MKCHKKNRNDNDNDMTARPDLPDILFVCVLHTPGDHNEDRLPYGYITISSTSSEYNFVHTNFDQYESCTSEFAINLDLHHVTSHGHSTH